MIDYTNILSQRVQKLKPSGIRKFFDMLGDMDDVISLTVGQPDFQTPWHIREAGIETLEKGGSYYTSNSGLLTLREEISKYLNRRFNLSYDPKDEIIVTIGGSEAIAVSLRALIDPGDEVIITSPCFVCYEPDVIMAGGVPVILNTEEKDKFKLTPEKLESAITEKTKLLILPFPNNPTGAVMTRQELEAVAKIIIKHNLVVLSDEIYAELTYGFKHTSIAEINGMRERTVLVNGLSKSYAMTGWRIGYVCAPKELERQILKLHQFEIMCAPTVSQYAATEAVKNGDDDIEYMKAEYNRRRNFIVKGLRDIGLSCFEPEGAFYVFPCISGFGLTSEDFCEKLLFEGKVAIVPGTAFGECGEGFARISYAYSVEHIEASLEKIDNYLRKLRG
ncbi:MAG: aminotransferase class I/II-fold pyridoxal phosphate-dependent enzyme [Clostridia bacterium]|nr:aminotransferase class I/II-fold pyridoxal phosphate-dependent enzyme [Clostridia bacterium]